jgi:hypothetical protein
MRATTAWTWWILATSVAVAGGNEPDLEDPDPAVRRRAVGRLAGVSGRVALARLVAALADDDPSVRDRAVRVLAGRKDPLEPPRLARTARRDGRALVREGLARVLARRPGEDGVSALIDLLGDRSARVRAEAARSLGVVGDGTAVDALQVLLRDRRPGPRLAALDSLDGIDPAGSATRAVGLVGDPDPDVRAAAVLVLERRPGEAADRALVSALDDGCWSVRTAAARAVSRIRLVDAVPTLIRRLDREEGRVREEVHEALAAVTGIGLPDDAARWRDWWEREGDGFRPPAGSRRRELERHASAVTYHSIPVTSRAVAFLIDTSRSMGERADAEDGPARRELALAELESTLRRLPRGTRFNVVLFGREVVRWQERARPVGPAAIAAAMKVARRVRADGSSDLFAALGAVFEDRSVDTVYLLTDGAPSGGRFDGRAALRAAVARLNRYRLVRIHTVGFGTDRVGRRWRGFLEELARDHGGAHVAR